MKWVIKADQIGKIQKIYNRLPNHQDSAKAITVLPHLIGKAWSNSLIDELAMELSDASATKGSQIDYATQPLDYEDALRFVRSVRMGGSGEAHLWALGE